MSAKWPSKTQRCINTRCAVVKFSGEWCPACEHDEAGHDMSTDAYEARCDDIEATRFEEWAHGGCQDDWHDTTSDSVIYNDAGEPMGYC